MGCIKLLDMAALGLSANNYSPSSYATGTAAGIHDVCTVVPSSRFSLTVGFAVVQAICREIPANIFNWEPVLFLFLIFASSFLGV